MRMNSYSGKQILSLVRDGDYAHAGEEEAIEMALRPYPRLPNQSVLDVGCGRGGTAQYIREHGWGQVVGIDIELASIARAKHVYPEVEFHACDVIDAGKEIDREFDLLCLFNSFYTFPDQLGALAVLAHLARTSGQLMLFDYVDQGGYARQPVMHNGEPLIPYPLQLRAIETMLRETGWRLNEVCDVTPQYETWYDALVWGIDRKRNKLAQLAGFTGYLAVRRQYDDLLAAIRRGTLGGAIVRAERRS